MEMRHEENNHLYVTVYLNTQNISHISQSHMIVVVAYFRCYNNECFIHFRKRPRADGCTIDLGCSFNSL